MSVEPDVGRDDEERDAERQATSMKDQLSKEVASWSKERSKQTDETAIAPKRPVVQQRTPRPTGEPKKASAPSNAGKAASARSKPFSMSYDGTSQAEYIEYLLNRGSR